MNKLLTGLVVLLGVALVASLVVVGLAVNRPVKVNVDVSQPLGSNPGINFQQGLRVSALKSQDGAIASQTNATLLAREFFENNMIRVSFATSVQALTLPSAAQLEGQCLDEIEAVRTVYLQNAS